jgi:hypothetical protein
MVDPDIEVGIVADSAGKQHGASNRIMKERFDLRFVTMLG